MKRSQHEEKNCGHWEYDGTCEVTSSGSVEVMERGLAAGNYVSTTRRLRFARAMTRELSGKLSSVEEISNRVRENHSASQRVDESAGMVASSEEIVVSRTPVLLSALSAIAVERFGSLSRTTLSVLDATEDNILDACEEFISAGNVPISHGMEGERHREVSSDASRPVGSNANVGTVPERHDEDEIGKENRDPLGQWNTMSPRSPLPAWFPRKPLQDITNVLASNPVHVLPQPKKKRNMKTTTVVEPQLEMQCETPSKNAMSFCQPKDLSCVASKKSSNLRKNYR